MKAHNVKYSKLQRRADKQHFPHAVESYIKKHKMEL